MRCEMEKFWCFLLLVIINFAVNNVSTQPLSGPKVVLPHGGAIVGTSMTTVNGRKVEAFLGIPYAEPPVGPLRFKAPLPADAWTGIKRAHAPAAACPQSDIFSFDKVPFGDEDCLYLNIYVPWERPSPNLPVMVWIHGGGYHMGSSDPILFGPERLLDNDIVLVTFNYRLGALGFLSTGTEALPGNYGLKDQNMVLQWVRDNIHAFSGNPYDVTLFGQSAGSASVSYHMISPMSKGLFHKAIMQSGSYYDPWAFVHQDKSIERLVKLGEEVGCPLKDLEASEINLYNMAACLQDIPAPSIVSTIANFYIDDTYFPISVFGPVIEPNMTGAFLTENPRNIIESHGTSIPLLIGVTSDEGIGRSGPILHQFDPHFRANFYTVLPKLLEYDHKPAHIRNRITERIDAFYFRTGHNWSKGNHQALTDMFSERIHFFGMDQFLRNRFSATSRPVGQTHVYVFGHRGPKSTSELIGSGTDYYGVAHGDDLPFIFPYGQLNVPGSKADQIMRWALPRMWTDFAWTGDPTPQGSTIDEHWKSTSHFPLRYAQIGNKKPMKNYKHIRSESPRRLNFTSLKGQLSEIVDSPKLWNAYDAAEEEYLPSFWNMDDPQIGPNDQLETTARYREARSSKRKHKKRHLKRSKKHKKTKKSHHHKHQLIIRNKREFIERRISMWRGMERLLCD